MTSYKRGREGRMSERDAAISAKDGPTPKLYIVRTVGGVDLGTHAGYSPQDAIESAWETRHSERARANPRLHDAPVPPIPWGEISCYPVP